LVLVLHQITVGLSNCTAWVGCLSPRPSSRRQLWLGWLLSDLLIWLPLEKYK